MPILKHRMDEALNALELEAFRDRHDVLFVDDPASTTTAADFRSATHFLGWGVVDGEAALDLGTTLTLVLQVAVCDHDVDDVLWRDYILGIQAIRRIWEGGAPFRNSHCRDHRTTRAHDQQSSLNISKPHLHPQFHLPVHGTGPARCSLARVYVGGSARVVGSGTFA